MVGCSGTILLRSVDEGFGGGFCGRVDLEFFVNAFDVGAYCFDGDAAFFRYHFIAMS